ncbi:uncharacterized protein [Drosophila bipectinata]|uniref:uncharacterized protein n=1 Tax=Drosophila bipectinata TaxID=42026 RepID=UPI0038B3E97F
MPPKAKKMDDRPANPVFITTCPEYNFLREYRQACKQKDSDPLTILREASNAWNALSDDERNMFEEDRYLRVTFDRSSLDAMGLAVDVVAAEQMLVHRTASEPSSVSQSTPRRRAARGGMRAPSLKMPPSTPRRGRKRPASSPGTPRRSKRRREQ